MKRKLFSIALVMTLILALPIKAYAADSVITYNGHNLYDFASGSEYSLSDLFDGFKGVMPGDKLTEQITITNTAGCCDYIEVYMRADAHGENNPLSTKVAETETVASMSDFLSHLTMTVKNGEQVIFQGSPDQTGVLSDYVYLGTLNQYGSLQLYVELEVPIELDNQYANRAGEVDWLFLMREYNYQEETRPGDQVPSLPQTGDHTPVESYVLLLGACLAGVLGIYQSAVSERKRKLK